MRVLNPVSPGTLGRPAKKYRSPPKANRNPDASMILPPSSPKFPRTHVQRRPQPSWELQQAGSRRSPPPSPAPSTSPWSPEFPALFTAGPDLLRRRHAPSFILGAPPFNLKTQFQRTVGILFPASSLASGAAEGTGPLSA